MYYARRVISLPNRACSMEASCSVELAVAAVDGNDGAGRNDLPPGENNTWDSAERYVSFSESEPLCEIAAKTSPCTSHVPIGISYIYYNIEYFAKFFHRQHQQSSTKLKIQG